RSYRGVQINVFEKWPLPVTYAIHKDWLVMSLFPQPVQGFVRRTEGNHRKWQTPPELREALAFTQKGSQWKGRLLSMSVTDPRPTLDVGLSLLPAFMHAINMAAGSKVLDLTKIPSSQSINEHIFPNVTLLFDDETALRWESRFSIADPSGFVVPL